MRRKVAHFYKRSAIEREIKAGKNNLRNLLKKIYQAY